MSQELDNKTVYLVLSRSHLETSVVSLHSDPKVAELMASKVKGGEFRIMTIDEFDPYALGDETRFFFSLDRQGRIVNSFREEPDLSDDIRIAIMERNKDDRFNLQDRVLYCAVWARTFYEAVEIAQHRRVALVKSGDWEGK